MIRRNIGIDRAVNQQHRDSRVTNRRRGGSEGQIDPVSPARVWQRRGHDGLESDATDSALNAARPAVDVIGLQQTITDEGASAGAITALVRRQDGLVVQEQFSSVSKNAFACIRDAM